MAAADSSISPDLEAVNEQLKGKIASIELANGSTVEKAKKVVVEPNFTYWMRKGEEHEGRNRPGTPNPGPGRNLGPDWPWGWVRPLSL